MSCLQQKLKRVKAAFRVWNKSIFGDIDRQVKLAIEEVNNLQHLIDSEGPTDSLLGQNLHPEKILTDALNRQDQFWRERAHNNNFIHGDRNTSYFPPCCSNQSGF